MNRNNKTLLRAVCLGLILLLQGTAHSQNDTTKDTAATATVAVSETNPHPPENLIFTEIHLSDEGVSAVDTSGQEWYYDFTQNQFIEEPIASEQGTKSKDWSGADELPIEERCTEKREVKPFERSSVLIGYDEYVDGDIIAIGRVTVKGWVKGDVKSIYNRVLVTETGRVDGNIEAPKIRLKKGAIVLGDTISTGTPLDLKDITETFSADGLIVAIVFTIVIIFFGFIIVTLMPQQLNRLENCTKKHPMKSYTLGFLFILLIPLIIVLFVITIIGILLVPFIPLLYFFAMLLGIISFGNRIGKVVSSRLLDGSHSLLFNSFIGTCLFMALWIMVAILLGQQDTTSQGFGIALLVLSIIITSYPVCTGIGASLLTRFGFREHISWQERQFLRENDVPTPSPRPLHNHQNNFPNQPPPDPRN